MLIATPLHEHAHITVDALKAGKHVFCEKAMAKTLPECKLMYDTAKQTGKILQIGHQRCFNPSYIKAIEYIRSGVWTLLGQQAIDEQRIVTLPKEFNI